MVIDTEGVKQPVPNDVTVTVVDQAYFDKMSKPYTLKGKATDKIWYHVNSNIGIDSLSIEGEVIFILADKRIFTVHNGVTVNNGSHLYIYSQSLGNTKGSIVSDTNNCITLGKGASLTNNAAVTATGTGKSGVYGKADISLINNGKNGDIKGTAYGIQLTDVGNIQNRGLIEASEYNSSAISLDANSTVINNITGMIRGHTYGINIVKDGRIDNKGTIRTTVTVLSHSAYGIYVNAAADIINERTGAIETIGSGVRFKGDGQLNNHGNIEGRGNSGAGVYVEKNSKAVIDNHGEGFITGSSFGIYLEEGCNGTIDNSGVVLAAVAIFATAETPGSYTKITNHKGGKIFGTTNGIRFPVDGEIYNYGTIRGTERCLYVSSNAGSFTLLNAGSLVGSVNLYNAVNTVTFTTGSEILGIFNLGKNPDSTLTFVGDLGDPLHVSTIEGNVNIGNVVNDIGGLVLPVGVQPGDRIVLIDGSTATMTGSPANESFTAGGYNYELKVEENRLIAVLLSKDPEIKDPEDPGTGTTDPEDPGTGTTEPEKPGPEVPKPEIPSKTYYITATADLGATISPMGTTAVGSGKNIKFSFSANDGYYISAVIVDGKNLSQTRIDLGYYIFSGVSADHTIEVATSKALANLELTINVNGGHGHAEYSVNGGSFVKYTSAVDIPMNADVAVRAVADNGYQFDRWETPVKKTTADIYFGDIVSALHLVLYFTDSGSVGTDVNKTDGTGGDADSGKSTKLLTAGLILLLFIAALLILFILFRKRYDVVKKDSISKIIGKDKARRKKAYTFTIDGGPTGTVSYRVAKDGEWKVLHPNPDGSYVIPKGEIIDVVTIKHL